MPIWLAGWLAVWTGGIGIGISFVWLVFSRFSAFPFRRGLRLSPYGLSFICY